MIKKKNPQKKMEEKDKDVLIREAHCTFQWLPASGDALDVNGNGID